MEKIPSQKEVEGAKKLVDAYVERYTYANKLLERRIGQLWGRLEIGELPSNIDERYTKTMDDYNDFDLYCEIHLKPISTVEGVESVVKESGSWLAEFLYVRCKTLRELSEAAAGEYLERYWAREKGNREK